VYQFREVIYLPKDKIDIRSGDCSDLAGHKFDSRDCIRLANLLSPQLFMGIAVYHQLVVVDNSITRIAI
jgi:hypothetical protein